MTNADAGSSLRERLDVIWGAPPGWRGRLQVVNHTAVGQRFIITGFVFFLIAGLLAMVMRAQIAIPGANIVDHETYNRLFTMHGTTMMFLFAVPMVEGFALYLIPKMIGARDLVFPRLGAYGYWCYLFGGLLLYSSFLFDMVPAGGWFMYVPLNDKEFAPDSSVDFWLLGVTFVEISSISGAIELIATILRARAPGMSLRRMPLFAWYMLVVAFMILIGFPPLVMGSILLELQRTVGLPFYDTAAGGNPLLWQHLFWIFGHPEVYIIFLPAAGMLSMIIPTFARRAIVGYSWVVLSVLATGFISFMLWAHHMYTIGLPYLSQSFFSAASLAVVIPSGIQIFSWIATLWTGRPKFEVPMLYVFGFFFTFVAGGLTGVMVAIAPFDWQVHDTHFVVAHLHYVLFGGMVFPLFAAFYYWLPKFSGRVPSKLLARAAFWLIFLGFNITFLPMHLTGFLGMPRRVYTYGWDVGWEWTNLISTVGGFVLTAGIGALVADLVLHFRYGRRAEGDVWGAGTLEWAVDNPATNYNFVSIGPVDDSHPLWSKPELAGRMHRGEYYLADTSSGQRETLGTSTLDGEPQQVIILPKPTPLPLISAVFTAFFFIGILSSLYWLSAASIAATVITMLIWAWQNGSLTPPKLIDAGLGLRLPPHYSTPNAPGLWGTGLTLAGDASLFGSLLFTYYYLWAVWPEPWPASGTAETALLPASLAAAALAASSLIVAIARRGVLLHIGLTAAALLSVVYLVLEYQALSQMAPKPTESAYSAVLWTMYGFVATHIVISLLMNGFVQARQWRGYIDAQRQLEPRVMRLFWHGTVIMGIATYATIHLFAEVI